MTSIFSILNNFILTWSCGSRQRDTTSSGWKFKLNNLAAKGLNKTAKNGYKGLKLFDLARQRRHICALYTQQTRDIDPMLFKCSLNWVNASCLLGIYYPRRLYGASLFYNTDLQIQKAVSAYLWSRPKQKLNCPKIVLKSILILALKMSSGVTQSWRLTTWKLKFTVLQIHLKQITTGQPNSLSDPFFPNPPSAPVIQPLCVYTRTLCIHSTSSRAIAICLLYIPTNNEHKRCVNVALMQGSIGYVGMTLWEWWANTLVDYAWMKKYQTTQLPVSDKTRLIQKG